MANQREEIMSDHAAIEGAAASWLMRRNEPEWSDRDQSDFDAWMAETTAHKAAYWRLEHGYAQLDRLAALPIAEPIGGGGYWPRLRAFAIAASLVALLIGGYLIVRPALRSGPAFARYSTSFGQVETIALADGSTVQLNTDSVVRVAIDDRQRAVWLDRGEAFFSVAHDPGRPFVIRADPGQVTAVGTKFSVFRQPGTVKVAVIEGRVRLDRPIGESAGSLVLVPGEVGTMDGKMIAAASPGLKQIEDGLAWRDGMARFDNVRLADAVVQFNRYNRRKLALLDREAGDIRIGGAFRLGNVDSFARLVNQSYGPKLRIVETNEAASR
jgi:transmembrane sensor